MTVEYLLDDGLRLDPAQPALWRGAQRVNLHLAPLRILIYLIENRGRYVNAEEIMKEALQRTIAAETLRVHMSGISKSLGDDPKNRRFIENDRRGGYRFVGAVRERASPDATHRRSWENIGDPKLLALPQASGDRFQFDDLRWYEREPSRLALIIGDPGETARLAEAAAGKCGPRPVPPGTRWQATVTDHEGVVSKIDWLLGGITTFEEKPAYIVKAGAVAQIIDVATLNYIGTVRDGKMIEITRPHEGVFSWPLSLGARWEGNFSYTNYIDRRAISAVVSRYEVTAYEEVSVPAGTFNAFRIEGTPIMRESVSRTAWYAPVPGVVIKRTFTRDAATDYRGASLQSVMELLTYPIANP